MQKWVEADFVDCNPNEEITIRKGELTDFIRKCANQKYQCQQNLRRATVNHKSDSNVLHKNYQLLQTAFNKLEEENKNNIQLIKGMRLQKETLQKKLKHQINENKRNKKSLLLKNDIINNFEWQKKIMLLETKKKSSQKEGCLQEVVKNQIQTCRQIGRKTKSIIIRKSKDNRNSSNEQNKMQAKNSLMNFTMKTEQNECLMQANRKIVQLERKLKLITIQKEHIQNEYKLQKTYHKGDKNEKLKRKCLLLQAELQKTTNSYLSSQGYPLSVPLPPITPHFAAGLTCIFSKQPHRQSNSTPVLHQNQPRFIQSIEQSQGEHNKNQQS